MTETSPAINGLLRIHRIITRGLGTSIRKCDEYLENQGIPSEEAEGFSLFITTLKWVTHAHHLSEDEIVFPITKDIIEAPYERLKIDHDSISRILESIDLCLADKSSVDIRKLRVILEEFNKLWTPHIEIEEEAFTGESLSTFLDIKDQVNISDKIASHSIKNSGPGALALPFLFYNLEGDDRRLFMMNIPWIVRRVLVPVVWRKQWSPMKPFFAN